MNGEFKKKIFKYKLRLQEKRERVFKKTKNMFQHPNLPPGIDPKDLEGEDDNYPIEEEYED